MEHITIAAGEAFGSGAHPSTALSLEWLGLLAPGHAGGRMLDVGCGSGILAIAGARLHGLDVLACDLQAAAVEQTRENARLNGVEEKVRVLRADGVRHSAITAGAPYELVIVNILCEVFLPWLHQLRELLAADGAVILAGVLRWQEERLREACAAAGLIVEGTRQHGDWVALCVRKA